MTERTSPIDRLSPVDAAFLSTEDAAAPLHVGGLVVVEPRCGFDYQKVLDLVGAQLDRLPRYRQIVRPVPGRLGRPVWVDDDFDLAFHVRRSSLPAPGGPAQLDELVGRLIARPLDRRRPLWELYIVEGLAGGRIAVLNKTHEALVDRVGAVDISAAILSDAPHVGPSMSHASAWVPTPAPSSADLVVDAVADLVARPSEAVEAARLAALDVTTTVKSAAGVARDILDVMRRSLRPYQALTVAAPGPRDFTRAEIDLDLVKRIRAAHGGTVNDVVLAIVAGALRSWLLSVGQPVTSGQGVRAQAPMSVLADNGDGPANVTEALVELPVAEPNPLMRLHHITYQTGARQGTRRLVGADALLALGRFAPPALHGLGARAVAQLSRRSYDMLVTNVPGPQQDLYVADDLVQAMIPVVPLARGHAMAIGCTSYRGVVYVGITVDRDAVSDPAALSQLVAESAAELADLAPSPTDE